jgi:hypothetical protein
MTFKSSKKSGIGRWVILLLFILIAISMIMFNKYFNLNSLVRIHIEKEKKLGNEEVNRKLYSYNSQTPISKLIGTDYQYLWVLPELYKSFYDCDLNKMDSASLIFKDELVGYILWTPTEDPIRQLPEFIERRIKSGQYQEVFNCKGYRFIRIR